MPRLLSGGKRIIGVPSSAIGSAPLSGDHAGTAARGDCQGKSWRALQEPQANSTAAQGCGHRPPQAGHGRCRHPRGDPLHGGPDGNRYEIGQTSVYQIIADHRKQSEVAAVH